MPSPIELVRRARGDLDYEADGRCHHSPGPADHEIDAWSALEDQTAEYEPALVAFCEPARIPIRVHATSSAASKIDART